LSNVVVSRVSGRGRQTRKRLRRGLASVGLTAFAFTLFPQTIAYQDLGALIAHQPGVAQRAREHLIASPFGTIHAATFSMPRPVGTGIPHPPIYALANFDPADITGAIGAQQLGDGTAPLRFPSANRKSKRDSFLARPRAPMPPLPPLLSLDPVPDTMPQAGLKKDTNETRFDAYSRYEFAAGPDETPTAPDIDLPYTDLPPANLTPAAHPGAAKGASRLFFGVDPMADSGAEIAPWAPGEAPVVLAARTADPDIKQSALTPATESDQSAGQSTVVKGEVTGAAQRPYSPAERLALSGASRAKAEKCLANAVYFESRGEPVRGQIAVAQVVLNRVFSPFYPKTVCDVVYQNAHRHSACQFTFACDGIPDIVTEPEAWERAKRIARDMLDGKLWMPEVAKSTHYHAYWVHPSWVNEMKKLYKLGVHTFYRPRAWGDGSDEPTWGDAKATAEEAKRL